MYSSSLDISESINCCMIQFQKDNIKLFHLDCVFHFYKTVLSTIKRAEEQFSLLFTFIFILYILYDIFPQYVGHLISQQACNWFYYAFRHALLSAQIISAWNEPFTVIPYLIILTNTSESKSPKEHKRAATGRNRLL